ncbi:MAG: hypothetical protein IJ599_02465 [Alphaproteobacteria bacterium]|nr:hypothetical protein [Alphaproteobacteria bacterium]
MPEHNDLSLEITAGSRVDSFKKSEGKESPIDAIDDFKSSLEPLKKQLADLVDQNKQVQSSYAECEEKVKKLSEKVSKVASPFEIFCNKTGVFL